MPSPTFLVQPQRSNGRCYIECDISRATSFAVIRVEKFTSRGKPFKSSRVISRHATRNQAASAAESHRLNHEKLPRDYKLGKRMEKIS